MSVTRLPELRDPWFSHASCGVGALVAVDGNRSHRLIEDGFRLVENLDHRGARGAEDNTGDGAGMLLQKPHVLFKTVIPELDEADCYGVGQAFFPKDTQQQESLQQCIEAVTRNEGLRIIAWRTVPTNCAGLGTTALRSEPAVKQFFVESVEPISPGRLDTKLYVLRRLIEKAVEASTLTDRHMFYICSLDRRKIVYKGLLTCSQLKRYYPDLSNPLVTTSLVLVHSRFSTNTLGAWSLAHPYRFIIHNGEINTLRGNLNGMKKREEVLESQVLGNDLKRILPIIGNEVSDTAILDNVLELLVEAGRSLPHALRMLIPEAWNKDRSMDDRRRAFYDFHSTIMEPWDGPALVIASDGIRVAAVLDRNGLRPCRYWLTKNKQLIMASETGVLDIAPDEIVMKGRLKPGQLFLADTEQGRIIPEQEIFSRLCRNEYRTWLNANHLTLKDIPLNDEKGAVDTLESAEITRLQSVFGYTLEQLRALIQPMAQVGKDPIGSMGNDTPLAVLSTRNKTLFQYFHQLFAQVSNPPIDYIREALVMSLQSYIGRQENLLNESSRHCRRLFLESPILTDCEINQLKQLDKNGLRACVVDITYPIGTNLREALSQIYTAAITSINQGYEILLLSDRLTDSTRIPVPALLAVSGLHHHLIRQGVRTRAAIVLDSGHPCTVHHFCTLIGYGADAINPWLAWQSVTQLTRNSFISGTCENAHNHYKRAIEGGLLKVMSKMGISTIESYKGAQVFESIGLNLNFVDEFFEGTIAHIPGIGLDQIENDLLQLHEIAYKDPVVGNLPLDQGGDLYWRRDGELHRWNPFTIGKLQHACETNDYQVYKAFSNYINEQDYRLQTLSGMLDFNDQGDPLLLEEVESVDTICKRFSTGSMSFGSLSREAHETLAMAMNRLHGISGTGEGGEQVDRFGTERECSMKQVASGRFGVTIDYLTQAKQIEIKMAQGSKPGEGGELPGGKVDEGIALVRFTIPGVGLISPPPHHDIYSIEDLAQLIHDLKCANPEAEIHVKLVATAGIGTIAAGVAKARADAVLISGYSGGTGASIKMSIKSAGAPLEIGLAETQQVLLANNLRSRIRLRADGGLLTGRDVIITALLGAEQFGFGTAPLVTLGCIMLRKCHCNTCSVGIATQDPTLRRKFQGKPEYVVNYMRFIANEVREYMARLGFRRMDDMIGCVDRLYQKNITHPKGARMDLSRLLYQPGSDDDSIRTKQQDHQLNDNIDYRLIEQAAPALKNRRPVTLHLTISNRDRTVGTLLSSRVSKLFSGNRLADDTITINCKGSAGQSFGAFLAPGITLHLEGDANDYVGKGLSGGKITVRTPREAAFRASNSIIIGNVALYGATNGEAYFNGLAGERFAVRNSGAVAVVEGIGDHGCEYMTGGVIVILGSIGTNFAAGMSGGEAFIYDEDGKFSLKLHGTGARFTSLADSRDVHMVKRLLENHVIYTQSEKATQLLDEWTEAAIRFVKVIPDSYADIIDRYTNEGKDIRPKVPPKAARLLTPLVEL